MKHVSYSLRPLNSWVFDLLMSVQIYVTLVSQKTNLLWDLPILFPGEKGGHEGEPSWRAQVVQVLQHCMDTWPQRILLSGWLSTCNSHVIDSLVKVWCHVILMWCMKYRWFHVIPWNVAALDRNILDYSYWDKHDLSLAPVYDSYKHATKQDGYLVWKITRKTAEQLCECHVLSNTGQYNLHVHTEYTRLHWPALL